MLHKLIQHTAVVETLHSLQEMLESNTDVKFVASVGGFVSEGG